MCCSHAMRSEISIVAIAILVLTCSVYLSTTYPAFAELKSITIDGPKQVLYNSVFSFHANAEGTSRASYGDFSVIISIVEKDTGRPVIEYPDYILPGKNTITWYPKEYGTGTTIFELKPNTSYLFRIQHVVDIWDYEFTAVDKVKSLTKSETPSSNQTSSETSKPAKSRLPSWIKDVFVWYSEGKVSEDDVINAIQYLVKQGIIVI